MRILALALLLLLTFAGRALALPSDPPSGDELQQQIDDELDRLVQSLDLGALQQKLDALGAVPDSMADARSLVQKVASGNFQYLGSDMLALLVQSVSRPISSGVAVFAQLFLLIVISGLLTQLTKSFSNEGASKVAALIVYAAAAVIIVTAMGSAIRSTGEAIDGLIGTAQCVFPVLSMMLAGTGGLASAAVLQPAWSVIVETASWMTKEVLIPAALYGGLLAVAGNLTEKSLLTELGSLVRSAGVWIAGGVMTVFVAVTAIQGGAAVSYDGISFRAAKYAVDSMVPYLGGMFSDMADTLVGCSLLVRNAVGMAGLLVMVAALLGPVAGALSTYFAFRLAAALSGALESKQLGAILGEAAKVTMLLLVILLLAFVLLFFMLTMTLNAGNNILAMR